MTTCQLNVVDRHLILDCKLQVKNTKTTVTNMRLLFKYVLLVVKKIKLFEFFLKKKVNCGV